MLVSIAPQEVNRYPHHFRPRNRSVVRRCSTYGLPSIGTNGLLEILAVAGGNGLTVIEYVAVAVVTGHRHGS
jgi:hypothetical protein